MGTFTAVLNLFKPNPAPAPTGDFIDVAALNTNTDKIEAAIVADRADIATDRTARDAVWQNFVPTVTGVASSSITYFKYKQIGKTIFVRYHIVMQPNATPVVTLPVNANTYGVSPQVIGVGVGYCFRTTAPTAAVANPYINNPGSFQFFASDASTLASGSYGAWSVSDSFRGTFMYESV